MFKYVIVTVFILAGFFCPVAAEDTLRFSAISDSRGTDAAFAVLQEAYGRLGIDIERVDMLGQAALEASSQGKTDGEVQRIDGVSIRYPDLIQIPIPINYLQVNLFVARDDLPLTNWASLRPYTVGVVKGILVAERNAQGLNTVFVSAYAELIDRLESGEIDVAIMPQINGLEAIKNRGTNTVYDTGIVLERAFLYHYLHKSQADLAPFIEKILKAMLLDKTIQTIRAEQYANLLPGESP